MGFIERRSCPACEGTAAGTLLRLPYASGPVHEFLRRKYPHAVSDFHVLEHAEYVLDECRDCLMIYQRLAPDASLHRALYEVWAEDPCDAFTVSQRNRGVHFFTKHADQIIDILRFLGRNPYEVRVFDFAFGWGHWCRLVQGFGCTVYGTEYSEKRRACASAIGITPVPIEELSGHRFDWINANQVFEHLAEPLATLRHLKTALAADGILSMAVPGRHRFRRRIARGDWPVVFDSLMPLEHLNFFPKGCLSRMAQHVGLVPVAIPERFVWRTGPTAFRQNIKTGLRILGAPVSNQEFLCFAHASGGQTELVRAPAAPIADGS
jgi:hypothetical protein